MTALQAPASPALPRDLAAWREDRLERRRLWLASPRGRAYVAWSALAGFGLLSAAAAVTLGVAAVTLFRKRRFYTEVMAKGLARAILRASGVELVLHRDRPFPQTQTIYTANHTSTLDAFILLALGLPNTRYFLKGEFRKIVPLGIMTYLMGTFFTPPQSRPDLRVRCFQRAERVLRRTGDSVYLSPEGTRVTDGTIGPFNKGTFHLATNLQVPIVPLYIDIPPDVNPGTGYAGMPGTVHVYVLPEVRTEGWRLEELLANKERVREVYVRFHEELGARRLGARPEEPRSPLP
ncbi:MAG: 1-acyl-sn-glycerol-3-phosphate acyltransferase [Deltaproteobacteria bacterium]|nr:1-acyl-sn-glycerol-3-phosphate acyltransferase [Deltaproteobacteria bacterium]